MKTPHAAPSSPEKSFSLAAFLHPGRVLRSRHPGRRRLLPWQLLLALPSLIAGSALAQSGQILLEQSQEAPAEVTGAHGSAEAPRIEEGRPTPAPVIDSEAPTTASPGRSGVYTSQDPRRADETTLPGVTVTAKGYESDSATTPVATTEIGQEALQRRRAANVGEALRHEPGLAVESDSAQGQNPVIRGLKKESIVLLVDGMRFNSAQPAGAVGSFMSLGLAEQVEVVKGPASVLYGTGALGGAINVRLPQARFGQGLQVRGSAALDSASRGREAAAVMNLGGEDHALMLGGLVGRRGDYRSPDGKVARTGYRSRALIGQYRFRLDAQQQLRLSAQEHRDEDVWYPGNTRQHVNPRIGTLTTHSPEQHRRLFELGYTHKPSPQMPLNVDLRVYRQEMKRSIYGHANGLGRDISRTDVTFATNGLDARVGWQVHPQHLLSVGTNLWRMRANPDARSAMPPAFAQLVSSPPFQNGEVRAIGVYVQDDIQIDRWKILAGLRHDRVKGSADSMNNGRIRNGLERSDGATSASIGALYEISPTLRPYLNLARAFRAPDLRERYQSGLLSDGFYYTGNPQIRPETATQIELGLKGASDTLDYAVAVFHNRISDYITGAELSGAEALAACGQANAAACRRNVNLGRATLSGLDGSLRMEVLPGHWMRAGYTLVRGTNEDMDEPLYQMPADRLTLGWAHRINSTWSVDADAYFVRRQTRVATRFTRGREDATPGYALLDVGADWQFAPQHTLRLAVKNLTDRRYHEHLAQGISGNELLATGRSVQLSWQGSF